ncbi:MAG: hypothetical protein MJA31_09200, partial [Clostridia bacterium]|nr:hypothetical protein [Clostridia bacterium]
MINIVIKEYLIADSELYTLLGGDYIWLVEKPVDAIANPYVTYKYKEMQGSDFIKDYQYEFKIVGDDLTKVQAIREKVIDLLDDPRGEKIIKNENTVVRHSKLFEGGEMNKNSDTGNFEM